MSPRTADPALRTRLIETAARIIAEEGPAALTSRRLAAEVGASTMAVFSRFPSMAALHRAVREEGFGRLNARLDALPVSADPVADLVAAGDVLFTDGVRSPHLHRAMFVDRPPEDDDLGVGTYRRLVALVRRCVAAGRFPEAGQLPAAAEMWAAQLWSMRQGLVAMAVAGLLPLDQVRFVLDDMTLRLLVGYGDDPARARASMAPGRTNDE
ncbi:TetR/AcrR family transcriptional regulator [Catenuloplanes atrovinosus]|uniref:AcrR family transcriptional regulator n=1 Tax=Catenuloplanes atrovinosus TaxID=137266 RepID=A0AAE4C7I9_9ACTN|nr:TetR family transcriptional regulator [Catenuloplanes atrovinosus]MDR7274586.1 AcrR family transcriptional regulator [Catenuloplanes atrovinosus]